MVWIHNPYTWDIIDIDPILKKISWVSNSEWIEITINSNSSNLILCDTSSWNMNVILIWSEWDTHTIKKTIDDNYIVSIVPNNWTIQWESSLELEWDDSVDIKFVNSNWIIL